MRPDGLLKLAGEGNRSLDLREFLDLVALGTIADLVPLTGESRKYNKNTCRK